MNFNPQQMIKNMMGFNNPKDMVIQMVKQSGNNNPILNNLIEMANKGDTQGIKKFARNYFKEQGKDFDTEFNNFKNMLNMK